jgi:hypothetical protein
MSRYFRLATVLSLAVFLTMLSARAADRELDPKASGYSTFRWNGGITKPFYHSDVRLEQPGEEYPVGVQAPGAPAVTATVPGRKAVASQGKVSQAVARPAERKTIPVTSREAIRSELAQLAMKVKALEIDVESDSVSPAGADAFTCARLETAADQLHTALVHYIIITQEQTTEREGSGQLSKAERTRLARQRRTLDGLLVKASELHLRATMLGASSHPPYQVSTLKAVKAPLNQMVAMMNQ